MENAPKTIPREQVTQNLLGNLLHDQEDFKNAAKILKHGQKDRLLAAMAVYPTQDIQFDESEPELRVAVTIWKRISDTLVAVGTEAAIEGILEGIVKEGKAGEVVNSEASITEETINDVADFALKGNLNE